MLTVKVTFCDGSAVVTHPGGTWEILESDLAHSSVLSDQTERQISDDETSPNSEHGVMISPEIHETFKRTRKMLADGRDAPELENQIVKEEFIRCRAIQSRKEIAKRLSPLP